MRSALSQAGFTLLELLLVLVILSVSAALVSPRIASSIESMRAKAHVRKLHSALVLAREKALRERKDHLAEIASEGASFDPVVAPGDINWAGSIEAVAPASIVFFRTGGSNGGRIDLLDKKNGSVYSIEVETTGRIRSGVGP